MDFSLSVVFVFDWVGFWFLAGVFWDFGMGSICDLVFPAGRLSGGLGWVWVSSCLCFYGVLLREVHVEKIFSVSSLHLCRVGWFWFCGSGIFVRVNSHSPKIFDFPP